MLFLIPTYFLGCPIGQQVVLLAETTWMTCTTHTGSEAASKLKRAFSVAPTKPTQTKKVRFANTTDKLGKSADIGFEETPRHVSRVNRNRSNQRERELGFLVG